MNIKYFTLLCILLIAIALIDLPCAEGYSTVKQTYKLKSGKLNKGKAKKIPLRKLKKPVFKSYGKRGKVMRRRQRKQRQPKRPNLNARAFFDTAREIYNRQPQAEYDLGTGHEAYHAYQQY